jgi:hypothetical protein
VVRIGDLIVALIIDVSGACRRDPHQQQHQPYLQPHQQGYNVGAAQGFVPVQFTTVTIPRGTFGGCALVVGAKCCECAEGTKK